MMKTYIKYGVGIIACVIGLTFLFKYHFNADYRNAVARKKIEIMSGDFKITYTDNTFVKAWTISNNKVTCVPTKGYYTFWIKKDGELKNIQTPIDRTFIEQL